MFMNFFQYNFFLSLLYKKICYIFTRYGVIHGTGELELQPLDKHVDEDEEDMTLFDVKNTKRPK